MITYNEIYESLRREKYSEQIQTLQKNFIQEVTEYLKEKKELSNKEADIFSDAVMKTKKQFENAVLIFKELMLRRKKKILNLAFVAAETGISKKDFDNLLEFEKEMFEKIMQTMESTDKSVMKMLNNEIIHENSNCIVSFKENIEEFLGLEGEKLGPFTKGEIVNLPEQIAKILIEAGRAEIIDDS
jgi:DNA replication initiation complex subunit (GINS family)